MVQKMTFLNLNADFNQAVKGKASGHLESF